MHDRVRTEAHLHDNTPGRLPANGDIEEHPLSAHDCTGVAKSSLKMNSRKNYPHKDTDNLTARKTTGIGWLIKSTCLRAPL